MSVPVELHMNRCKMNRFFWIVLFVFSSINSIAGIEEPMPGYVKKAQKELAKMVAANKANNAKGLSFLNNYVLTMDKDYALEVTYEEVETVSFVDPEMVREINDSLRVFYEDNHVALYLCLDGSQLLDFERFIKPNGEESNTIESKLNTEVQKQIVVILKDWKSRNNLPLSSHLLEYLILDTYKYNIGRLPKNIEGKVVLVLDHIADNLQCAYIRGIENTNNIITNSIGEEDKDLIVDVCRNAIENYNYQPNSLARELS